MERQRQTSELMTWLLFENCARPREFDGDLSVEAEDTFSPRQNFVLASSFVLYVFEK